MNRAYAQAYCRSYTSSGGNEYREGRERGDVRPYNSDDRANDYIRSYMKNHS